MPLLVKQILMKLDILKKKSGHMWEFQDSNEISGISGHILKFQEFQEFQDRAQACDIEGLSYCNIKDHSIPETEVHRKM